MAVLGTAVPGPKSFVGPLFENFLLTKIILQVFFVTIFMPQGCIQMFSCDFFSIFLRCGAPSGLPKVQGLGPWPPWPPLKPPLTIVMM